jgi:hypothetical protein
MTGRFFALESGYNNSCDHGPGMGCDKCYWKHMRKNRPAVVITLVSPEEPDRESYPVMNGFDQAFIMPSSPW